METVNRDKIEEILPRYCSGEATIEECRMVEEWIQQSDENYRIVKQMYTIDQVVATVQMESKVDMEKALASVNRKMSNAPSHITWFTWVQRLAAILFIPLFIA
ncbi:MAG: anti-sigma factor, partial [Tannerellaceae bacterium]